MKFLCRHKGRARGVHFERCLECRAWRLILTRRWYPASVPIPSCEE